MFSTTSFSEVSRSSKWYFVISWRSRHEQVKGARSGWQNLTMVPHTPTLGSSKAGKTFFHQIGGTKMSQSAKSTNSAVLLAISTPKALPSWREYWGGLTVSTWALGKL